MATQSEQDAGEIRDTLEKKIAPAIVTALAARPEDENAPVSDAVTRAIATAIEVALIATIAAIIGYLRRSGRVTEKQTRALMRDKKAKQRLETVVTQRAAELANTATDWAAAHVDHLEETGRPTQPPDRAWADQAARSLATQAAAQVMEDAVDVIAPPLAEITEMETYGEGWRKIWISRGDKKVRPLHRRLHGQPADLDKAFWRWPVTGKQLRYPGDPEAPIGETANCRCVMFYVPMDVAPSDVTEALAPADFDISFDIVAASAGTRSETTALIDFMHERAMDD